LRDGVCQHLFRFGRALRKHLQGRLEAQEQSMEALKQRIVQLAGDSRALRDAGLERHLERVLDLPHPVTVRRRQERHEHPCPQQPKPGSPPPGGRDEDRQRHALFVPDAIGVRTLHAEQVFARVEIGVGL
jgi:hypothetical protein